MSFLFNLKLVRQLIEIRLEKGSRICFSPACFRLQNTALYRAEILSIKIAINQKMVAITAWPSPNFSILQSFFRYYIPKTIFFQKLHFERKLMIQWSPAVVREIQWSLTVLWTKYGVSPTKRKTFIDNYLNTDSDMTRFT